MWNAMAPKQDPLPPLRQDLEGLTALAADLLGEAEDTVAAIEYAAAATVVEGARSVLMNVGLRLEWMARRIKEAL